MVNVSKEGEVYECEICGNVVVVKDSGGRGAGLLWRADETGKRVRK